MSFLGFGKAKQQQIPPQPKEISKEDALSEFDIQRRKLNALNILTNRTAALPGSKMGL